MIEREGKPEPKEQNKDVFLRTIQADCGWRNVVEWTSSLARDQAFPVTVALLANEHTNMFQAVSR